MEKAVNTTSEGKGCRLGWKNIGMSDIERRIPERMGNWLVHA